MARRWLVLNILLLAISAVLAFQIVRILGSTRLLPEAAAPAASPTVSKEEPPAPRPPLTAYSVIPTRNLFNASRSETISTGPGQPGVPFPTLQLHGVVVVESGRTAYLEDPSTKRTHGYRVGDSIAAGRIERIESDRVIISRGEGVPTVEVLLRDPSRPRPVAAQVPPTPPGVPPQPLPGTVGPPPVPQPGRPVTPGLFRRPGGMPLPPQPPAQPGPTQ
jgi:hypothetical protein